MKFLIHSIREDDVVIGRNYDQDIPLGTAFTSITKSKVIRGGNEYKTIELGNVGSINLVLEKIDWYKPIEVVPRWSYSRVTLSWYWTGNFKGKFKRT